MNYLAQFGKNAYQDLLKQYKLDKLLIVTDLGVKDAAFTDSLTQSLDKAGISYDNTTDVQANAPIDIIISLNPYYNEHGFTGVVAIGGGSVMDTAKAIAVQVAHPTQHEYSNDHTRYRTKRLSRKAAKAVKEANLLSPAPHIFTDEDFIKPLYIVKGDQRMNDIINNQRTYFNKGTTLDPAFRIAQLKK